MNVLTAYVTFANSEEAHVICKSLVEKHIAACANILSPHTAIYHWDGKLNEHSEVAALLKTTSDRIDDLVKEIKAMHSYDEPCIVTWNIEGGSWDFINWVVAQTNR